ncbi:MAG: PhzF family phenazine biosynthesis protein [Rudaea sp.]
MPSNEFYIVDVFAEGKYEGNQLAVFREAAGLSTAEMQAIAREMHFSETTFLLSDRPTEGGYDVRIFTPETELPFAGHPTLGTAFVIQREVIKEPAEQVVLNLKVGRIPVTFSYKGNQPDVLWMRQVPPKFGEQCTAEEVALALRIGPGDIDSRFPLQVVSTGIPFLIVPLKTLDAVKRANPDWAAFDAGTAGKLPRAVLVFAPETYFQKNDLNVRVFVDEVGVPEDPATGSGNGCLAGYLVKYRYFDRPEIDLRVEQGYEIKRPSLLLLRAKETESEIEVNVGGRAVFVAKGQLV